MPKIEVKNLTKRFGKFEAVKRVEFTIENREYVSIVGPSGCGKTTLLRTIAGILRQDEGHIYFDGEKIDDKPIEERGIGYVFQNIALFPHMNVLENISYGPRAKGYELNRIKVVSVEVLEMMKLSERYANYPIELSGGMQQKVAVARCLASEPNVLLLDEPLSMLDAKVRKALRFELRRIVKDLGLTAIHVTHDQEEALAVSDRVFIMRKGELIESGRPEDLYFSSKRIFTAYFLGESNIFEGKVVSINGGQCYIDVGGLLMKTKARGVTENSQVVVVIRPELIEIKKTKHENSIPATIRNVTLEGAFYRCELDLANGLSIVAKFSSSSRERHLPCEEVGLLIPPELIKVYPYPEGGLNNEISL